MKFKKFAYAVLPALFSVASAQAAGSEVGFVIEPYAGWGTGGFSVSANSGASVDMGTISGVGLGARGLLQFGEMFFVGPDFSFYPGLGFTASSLLGGGKDELTSIKNTKLGLVGGIELPMAPVRFWLGFNILDSLSFQDSSATSGAFNYGSEATLKGTSFKVGAGYKFLPILSGNIEYVMASYTKVTSGEKSLDIVDGSFKNNRFLITLSAPFSL